MRQRWSARGLARRATGGPPTVLAGLRSRREELDARTVHGVLDLALRTGEAMLSLGAAAVDVTDAVRRVLSAFGLAGSQVDLTFTSITVSAGHGPDATPVTMMRVVQERVQDYGRLARVEELAREVTDGRIPIADAPNRLERAHADLDEIVAAPQQYQRWVVTVALAALAASVALLLGGGLLVAAVAAATTAVIDRVVWRLARWGLPAFFTQAAGAAVAALVAVALYQLLPLLPVDAAILPPSLVVASGIVVLLAGLSLVGAAEDAISGFPITAAARSFEVVVLTLGIVVGIAGVLDMARRVGVPLVLVDPPVNTSPLLVQVLAALACAATWAVAAYSRPRAVAVAGGAGALAWLVFSGVTALGVGPAVASAVAAVVVGALSEAVGGRWGVPTIVTSVCGIVPLLPGLTIYRSLFAFAGEPTADPVGGLTGLFSAALIGLGLASGVSLGEFLARPLRLGRTRRRATEEREVIEGILPPSPDEDGPVAEPAPDAAADLGSGRDVDETAR
ncbi:threonine/serine exporter family protein [Georgenia sp. MJ206]|uniref:threonine/serine ThrE exporter family protein n=1 Tax=Georgenia wangjunii TaxID=3117730 RepID=UPI002F26BB8B